MPNHTSDGANTQPFFDNLAISENPPAMGREALPHDLVTTILSCLPPETLLRFRSVCKSWLSTIGDSKFIAVHRQRQLNTESIDNAADRIVILEGLIADRESATLNLCVFPMSSEPLPIIPPVNLERNIDNFRDSSDPHWKVWGTCNGLVCCSAYPYDNCGSIILCNPSTRWMKILPNLPTPYNTTYADGLRYLFTAPIESSYIYFEDCGIGFDEVEKDYKVVRMRQSTHYFYVEVAVYSLKSNSWKRVEGRPDFGRITLGKSVLLHGFIHWCSCRYHRNQKTDGIMLFDVQKEVFGEMQYPTEIPQNHEHYVDSIYVVRGSLCAMVLGGYDGRNCQMWIMKEYGDVKSWTKQFNVDFRGCIKGCQGLTFGGKIFCMTSDINVVIMDDGEIMFEHEINGSEIGDPINISPSCRKLVLYDPQTNKYTKVCQASNHYIYLPLEGSLEPSSHLESI